MGERTAEVVIIGAGIVGASVAYHLAARGCTDVLILEQAETEITGSTARSAAGVRHQFSTEVNVRMSLYSIERLKRFEEEIGGHSGLQQVGYLFLINQPEAWEQYQASVAMQRRLGARVELLTPEEAARLVPGMRTDDLCGATYGPDDGYCDPHGIALGYLNRARELGARLARATPATGFRIAGGRVPLTIHLLSPAHRPVQITRDLAGFWKSGYFEVKKDLKGRYPKHYWPDDPLTANPTNRVRPL